MSAPPAPPSTGRLISPSRPPNHDPEKPAFHNGHAYAEERTHSKTDKDEEEDEDLDMLIEELESLDPDEQVEAELDAVVGGGHGQFLKSSYSPIQGQA